MNPFVASQFGIVRRERQPTGFSLVEMLTAITTASVIMTAAAVSISSLHRVNHKLRDELPRSAALVRLAARLRSDAHAAQQAELATGQGNSGIRLTFPDQRTVQYAVDAQSPDAQRVLRTEQVADQPARHDTFPLPPGSTCEWSYVDEPGPLARLIVRWHAGRLPGADDDWRAMSILAAVGVNDRERGEP